MSKNELFLQLLTEDTRKLYAICEEHNRLHLTIGGGCPECDGTIARLEEIEKEKEKEKDGEPQFNDDEVDDWDEEE